MTHKTIRFLILFLISVASIQATDAKKYGLAPLRGHERIHLEQHAHKLVGVNHNSIGRERVAAFLGAEHSVLEGNEFLTMQISSEQALQMLPLQATLPSSVNNSLLPCFPPIGDQGQIGSCVAWGSTYYQATHEIGLLNEINNQAGGGRILSPKWTYDLLNGGQDGGLSVLSAYELLAIQGAPTFSRFPYDTNYTAWELDPEDWIAAINNRMATYTLIPGLGGSGAQNLTAIKTALVNGHILTFATFINSWVFTQIKHDPQNLNNSHVGEYAAVYMNGMSGGHFMTIVGYDDTLWIDVNGNGTVNTGERGAFLIANSWGNSWGNQGFIWISYDAFLSASGVVNGPNRGRVAAGTYLNSSVILATPKAKNYSPSLVAQFSLSQSKRNQIGIQGGISSIAQNTPAVTFSNYGLTNQGGALGFNGASPGAPQTMTFALDFTDLLGSISGSNTHRYYLTVSDNATGDITQLNSYTLIDFIHNNQISAFNLPKTYDNASGSVFLDYDFVDGTAPAPVVPSVAFASPASGANLSGTASVSANASDTLGVRNVRLFVDSTLIGTMTQSGGSYTMSVDTTKFSNGSHQLIAIATNTSDNTAQATVSVEIANIAPLPSFFVNAGGPRITSQGHTWVADNGYVFGSSKTNSTRASFVNPVYQTAHLGNMTYQFTVPNGQYLVTLKFAEFSFKRRNQRKFNVAINGASVLNRLDLVAAAGFGVPYDQTFPVTVTNGSISIAFSSVLDKPQINAIAIVPAD